LRINQKKYIKKIISLDGSMGYAIIMLIDGFFKKTIIKIT